jgi:hypothetical protein
VSPLPAFSVTRRSGGASGARFSAALSARRSETSSRTLAPRGTSSVEPALTSILGGMRLISRSADSAMPVRLAASDGLMVLGTTQAVQVASGPVWRARFSAKALAWS